MVWSIISKTLFTLFILAVTALGINLSHWQLERLQWKNELLANIEAMETVDPWGQAIDLTQPDDFVSGTITGQFLSVPSIKIAPRMSQERMGAHALTPFKTECCVLWVNRGWVPEHWQEQDRNEGTVQLAGALQSPDVNSLFQPANYPEQGIWYWTDITDMNASAGLQDDDVLPYVFNLKGQKPSQTTVFPDPVAVDTVKPHNRHLSYAIFWGVMAIIILIMGGWRLVQMYRPEEG